MNPLQRMDELIQSYIDLCIKLEIKYDGLTVFVLAKTNLKKLELKALDHYRNMRLTDFILTLNSIRNEWISGATKFTQQEMML